MAFTKIVGAGIHTLSNVNTHNINSSGIITATQFVGIFTGTDGDFSGDVTIDGNLTVNGTTTTLDTNLINVDKIEVTTTGAIVGVAVTQNGSGDLVRLYDGSTQVVTVDDEGKVGIGTDNPTYPLEVWASDPRIQLVDTDLTSDRSVQLRNHQGSAILSAATHTSFYNGGDERVRIESGGDVGIGTNNPRARLHIFDVNPVLRLTDSNQAADNQSWNIAAGNTQILRIQAINDAGGGGGNLFDFYRSGNNINELRGMQGGNYWFVVDNLNKKVGIGTNNVQSLLHLKGTGDNTSGLRLDNSHNNVSAYFQDNNTNSDFLITYGGTGGAELTIHADGNLGLNEANGDDVLIGTSSVIDNSKLTIVKAAAGLTTAIALGNGNASGEGSKIIATKSLVLGADYDNNNSTDKSYLGFETDGVERLRINSSGRMGLGTNNPNANFHIKSTFPAIRLEDDSDYSQIDANGGSLRLLADAGNASSNSNILFSVDGDERLRITSDGEVGIGTDNPDEKLHVYNGAGNVTSFVEAIAGDALLNLSNSGNGNYSGINFIRERGSGQTGRNGGSIFMPSNTANNEAFLYIQAQSTSAHAGITGALSANNGVRLKLHGDDGIFSVETGAHERLRITNNGRVGIGTDDPSQKLTVVGGGSSIGGILVQNVAYANNQDRPYLTVGSLDWDGSNTNWGTHGIQHRVKTDNGGTPRVTIDALVSGSSKEIICIKVNNRVGIGTDNPAGEIDIWSDSPNIKLVDTNPYAAGQYGNIAQYGGILQLIAKGDGATHGSIFLYAQNDSELLNLYRTSDNTHQWYTASDSNSMKMRLLDSGNLGIGIGTPQSVLDVRQKNDGGQTKIMLWNTDNDNTTTQTAGFFMSPDSRAYAYTGISVKKENADMSSSSARDVSLVLNVTQNNSQVEAVSITSGGHVNIAPNNLDQTAYKVQIETGANRFLSIKTANHDDFSDEGSGIFFSRQSDGAKELSGIFAHTNASLGMASRQHLTFHAGGSGSYNQSPERLRITSDGEVLINENGVRTYVDGNNITQTPKLQVEADDNSSSAIALRYNAGAGSAARRASFIFARTADGSAVSDSSVLGEVLFMGEGNNTLEKAASVRAEVDGTPGTNDMPGRLIFSTSADGSDSPDERLRIDSSGSVIFKGGEGGTDAIKVQSEAGGMSLQISNFRGVTDTGDTARLGVGKNNNILIFTNASGSQVDTFAIGNTDAIPLVFSTANTERLRIKSDGVVQLNAASNTHIRGGVYAKYTGASGSTGNLNNTTINKVSWLQTNTEIFENGGFTNTATDVTVPFDGIYMVMFNGYLESANIRTNVRFRFKVNGNDQNADFSLNNYIRRDSSHNESSANLTAYLDLSAGDTVAVASQQIAATGTVTMAKNLSSLTFHLVA